MSAWSAFIGDTLCAIVYCGAHGAFGEEEGRRNESARHVNDSSTFGVTL